jgi:hypothetical protein
VNVQTVAAGVSHSLVVVSGDIKSAQTITFPAPGNKTYGAAPFNLSGSATSGLPLTFLVVSGPATIAGRTVTLTGKGLVTLAADQPGNANYLPAAEVTHSFTVN